MGITYKQHVLDTVSEVMVNQPGAYIIGASIGCCACNVIYIGFCRSFSHNLYGEASSCLGCDEIRQLSTVSNNRAGCNNHVIGGNKAGCRPAALCCSAGGCLLTVKRVYILSICD